MAVACGVWCNAKLLISSILVRGLMTFVKYSKLHRSKIHLYNPDMVVSWTKWLIPSAYPGQNLNSIVLQLMDIL